MRAALSLAVLAGALWLGVVVLALTFEGDGSPVGQGAVTLLAVVVSLLARDRFRAARVARQRDHGQ